MGWEVNYHITYQSKHGLWRSSVKTGKFLPWCSHVQKHIFFGPKSKEMLFVMGQLLHPHTKPVYISAGVFRNEKSSNRIEISKLVQDLLNFY